MNYNNFNQQNNMNMQGFNQQFPNDAYQQNFQNPMQQFGMGFQGYPNQFQQQFPGNQIGQNFQQYQDQYEDEEGYDDEGQDDCEFQEDVPESWDQQILSQEEQYQNYLQQQIEQQRQQQEEFLREQQRQQELLQQQQQQQQAEQPKPKKKLVLRSNQDFVPTIQKEETPQQPQFVQQIPSLNSFNLNNLGLPAQTTLQQGLNQPMFGMSAQQAPVAQKALSFDQWKALNIQQSKLNDNSEDDNVQFGFDSSKGVATFGAQSKSTKKVTKKDTKKPVATTQLQQTQQLQAENKPKVIKRIQKMIDNTTSENSEAAQLIQKLRKRKAKADRYTELDIASWDYDSKYMSVDTRKKPVNIVFVGHVDVGKSTICGNILLLSGKVDEADLRKYEQEAKEKSRDSWYLAYIMDINDEERNKGKTVEVGKATFQTENRRFTLLDAPGHKNYVPNMIQGAAQADIAAMVISAKTGEFESGFEKGGQTREHAMLVRCIGVQNLIILVNKMDEVNWSIDRFNYIKEQLGSFLQTNIGYDLETQVTWVPITGLFGDNLQKRVDKKACPWYDGPTFFELLDDCKIPKRNPNGPVRIPVMDRLKEQGGVFITGKIESGIIKQDMELTLMPFETDFQILSIQNADEDRVYYAMPGENVKIKVKGLEEKDIEKGYMVCTQDDNAQVTNEFEAIIDVLELPDHKSIMSSGYQAVLHIHCAAEECEVSLIKSKWDESKRAYIETSFLKSNMKAVVRIKTYRNICVEKHEVNQQLGSFTLRDEGRTIALGQINRIKPAKKLGPQLDAKVIEQIRIGQEQQKKGEDQQIELKQ